MKLHLYKLRNLIWHGHKSILVVAGLFVIVGGLQVGLLIINLLRYDQPVVGLKYQSHSLTFLSDEDLSQLVNASIVESERQKLTIKAGSFTGHITARQLGARYTNKTILKQIRSYGRTGNPWQRIMAQDSAALGLENQTIGFPKVDANIASRYISYIEKQIKKSPQNAKFAYKDDRVVINDAQPGTSLDTSQSAKLIQQLKSNPNNQFELPVTQLPAEINAADLKPYLPQVEKIASKPLVLTANATEVQLDKSQLVEMVDVKLRTDPAQPSKKKADLSFNEAKVNSVLDDLGSKATSAPKAKVTSGGRVIDPGAPGYQIDHQHAKVDVVAALVQRQDDKTPVAPKVSVQVETLSPPVINKTPAVAPTPAAKPPVIALGNGSSISLTFDDGPNGTYTGPVLDILKRYGVHATFFLIGRNTANYPDVARRIKNEGHTIGNHSFTHSDLTRLSPQAVTKELADTQNAINQATGLTPTIFRPPFGSLSAAVRAAANGSNLQVVMWTVDPRDWSEPGSTVITSRVLTAVHPGANILLHVLHQQTVDALPSIIEGLRARGYVIN